jgi:hypothetical protein
MLAVRTANRREEQATVANVPSEKKPSANVTSIGRASPQAAYHLEQIVRRRAYELYEQRGRRDGHAQEDWLRAEEEIQGTRLRRARVG